MPFHRDAGARQAGGDEGAGGAAVRDGPCQPRQDRPAVGGEPRGGLQVAARRGRGDAGAVPSVIRRDRADRRDVALRQWEKNKIWIWRAYDPVAGRTLAWELGGRDDETVQRLLDKLGGTQGKIFVTDDGEGFHRLIPADPLFTGKDLTFPIEQDNSLVRHYLARFRRRSKVTSRARHMVDKTLRLLAHFLNPENYPERQNQSLCIFG